MKNIELTLEQAYKSDAFCDALKTSLKVIESHPFESFKILSSCIKVYLIISNSSSYVAACKMFYKAHVPFSSHDISMNLLPSIYFRKWIL